MHINLYDLNYHPSVDQIAQEIWDMADYQQAELINKLSKISNQNNILNRLYSMFKTNIIDKDRDGGWLIHALKYYKDYKGD